MELEKAVKELKNLKNVRAISDACIRINSVENQADYVFNLAVADLFFQEKDAIRLIKYKEWSHSSIGHIFRYILQI